MELNNEELLGLLDQRTEALKKMVRDHRDCPANRKSYIRRLCEVLSAISAAPSDGRNSDRDSEVLVVTAAPREPKKQ